MSEDFNIHGVLACSGVGSRFAQSVGKISPYPKHLEQVGYNKTILHLAVDAMVRYIPVSGITLTLHPQLQDLYVPYLRDFQKQYPDVEFSYAVTTLDQTKGVFDEVSDGFQDNVYTLDDEKVRFPDSIAAVGFGDTLLDRGDPAKIRQDISDFVPDLEAGRNMVFIKPGFLSSTRIYHISRKNSFTNDPKNISVKESFAYGLRCWNINTRSDLIAAKENLGYPISEEELDELRRSFGKERL